MQLFPELIGWQLDMAEDLSQSQRDLEDAERRQAAIAAAERDIRDLFQPIVTGLDLLRTSPTLTEEDRRITMQMQECSEQIGGMPRNKLENACAAIEPAAPDDVPPPRLA